MENMLVTSLMVSGLGMLLLFVALVLLYVVMYVMPSVLRDRIAAPEPETYDETKVPAGESIRLQVAAIAVALARATQEMSPVGTIAGGEGTTTDSTSPWWSFHHGRQLDRKPLSRRTP